MVLSSPSFCLDSLSNRIIGVAWFSGTKDGAHGSIHAVSPVPEEHNEKGNLIINEKKI